jgi:preprotein translocase subunit YajC
MSSLTDALPLFAQQSPGSGGPAIGTNVLFFGLIFAAMYFLMIAPQRKKQKQHEKMLAALGTGDEIVTTGGIFGTITNVKEDRFVLRIADNTKIEIGKGFVQSVIGKSGAAKS